MKRIFLAASLIIAASTITGLNSANASTVTVLSSGDGQHIPASAVPAPVRQSFHANFPGASNADWEKEKEHGGTTYKVDFLNNGKKWRAVFAPDGSLLSSGRR